MSIDFNLVLVLNLVLVHNISGRLAQSLDQAVRDLSDQFASIHTEQEENSHVLATRMEEQEETTGRVIGAIGQLQREHADTANRLSTRMDRLDNAQTEQDEITQALTTRIGEQEEATGRVTEAIGRVQREQADMASRVTIVEGMYNCVHFYSIFVLL